MQSRLDKLLPTHSFIKDILIVVDAEPGHSRNVIAINPRTGQVFNGIYSHTVEEFIGKNPSEWIFNGIDTKSGRHTRHNLEESAKIAEDFVNGNQNT